ncbi:hypothetical protein ACFOED_11530 [Vulcaniibacterium thermophilum]|jgi:ABC-type uncharacterized transport system permease subunit|uniref:Uncharacterized protein n=1 Tax=Vulcaniibacterium thermophilum TaxID=1169913 RepID=A0A918ZC18_9GAMM|nr:hypothetical protein [Vulcaniibacterium thermophilum]GHE42552.1 hypothetical protein GCM10007167_25560 [Vulcaniibacterium thermophilum]
MSDPITLQLGFGSFLFGIFCAYWAQTTGRNPWLWFACGFLFSPITGLVLLWKNRTRQPAR